MRWRAEERSTRIQPSKDNIEQTINPHLEKRRKFDKLEIPFIYNISLGLLLYVDFYICNCEHLGPGQLPTSTLARLPANPPTNGDGGDDGGDGNGCSW